MSVRIQKDGSRLFERNNDPVTIARVESLVQETLHSKLERGDKIQNLSEADMKLKERANQGGLTDHDLDSIDTIRKEIASWILHLSGQEELSLEERIQFIEQTSPDLSPRDKEALKVVKLRKQGLSQQEVFERVWPDDTHKTADAAKKQVQRRQNRGEEIIKSMERIP